MKPANVVSEALHRGVQRLAELPQGRRDAQLLLLRVMGKDLAWLLAHPEVELTAEQAQRYDEWLTRRARHEPVQYILGETEFHGLRLKVTRDVLIPRPETEHVVEAVVARVPQDAAARICDVGTGSGAIAVALAHQLPRAEVTAVDVSRAALAVARENAERHGVAARVRFVESDLLAAVRGERFDVVVANPPYVANGEVLERQIRGYEPHKALFAGETGLEVIRRLIPEAWGVLRRGEEDVPQGLKPRNSAAGYGTAEAVPLQKTDDVEKGTRVRRGNGGWLVMEMGQGQRDAVAELLVDWDEVSFVADLQGIARVAIARRRAAE